MKKVLETLKQHIRENPPNYGDADSILDMLFWHYTEYNKIDNKKIKERFSQLRETMGLPPRDYDEVYYLVGDLCLEHSRLAFRHGLELGLRLVQELSDF